MENDKFGLLYGITNKYFEGMVKIGVTHSLDISKRIRVLNTAVPEPFDCAFAYKVPHNELYKIERILHETFADKRIGNSEFFRIDTQKVDKLISALGKFEAAKTTVQQAIGEDENKKKSPNMDFYKMGLKKGDVLLFKKDKSITCTVETNKKVLYNGSTYSLSGLTKCITNSEYAVQPSPLWETQNGKPLNMLYVDYIKNT